MRIRKDLVHAWIGWRDCLNQKDCPGCARAYGVLPCTTPDLCRDGGVEIKSRGYHCRHCRLEFTLHFRYVPMAARWRVP